MANLTPCGWLTGKADAESWCRAEVKYPAPGRGDLQSGWNGARYVMQQYYCTLFSRKKG